MDAGERSALIERYRDGYRHVKAALDGIVDEELDLSVDGGWTPRQVVNHLGDAELIGAERLRRLLGDPEPLIQSYDEAVFAERLPMDRPIEPSLEVMRWSTRVDGAAPRPDDRG